MKKFSVLVILLATISVAATAQTPAPSENASQNAIVVTARRSGAPMWNVDTPTGAVILVGDIVAIPKSTRWYPDQLLEATTQANRVIVTDRPDVSFGDIAKLIFSGGHVMSQPKGTTKADFLTADQLARLAALEAKYDKNYARTSLLMTAFDLLTERLEFADDVIDAAGIVEEAADDADVPIVVAPQFAMAKPLDVLFEAPFESHLPCLDAAMTAAEIGRPVVEARADAWRSMDIPALMANPLEVALGQCWPWGDPNMGEAWRTLWSGHVERALSLDGVTVAAVPLRVLAEPDGVLDRLEAEGRTISGPQWRSSDAAP